MTRVVIAVLSWIVAFLSLEYVFEHFYSFDTWLATPTLERWYALSAADLAAFFASLSFGFAVGAF